MDATQLGAGGPSRGRPSSIRGVKSFGLKSIQIERSREQRGRERRAAADIYCVPGSMRLFCLLGKGEWTSLTSCVGDMAEEPHRQRQHETEPVSKGTRTPWASGRGELSARGRCRHAPRAGGLVVGGRGEARDGAGADAAYGHHGDTRQLIVLPPTAGRGPVAMATCHPPAALSLIPFS